MNPEESNVKDIEHVKDKIKIIFASIAAAILMMVMLYLMINSPTNYIAIALFGILILGDLYFLISSLIEISYRRDLNRREQYDGIYKAEKASYMIFRKYFDSLAKTLESMDEKLEMPAEEIISAQKAVAKVTINRSKENTDALMNSNDKLIEKLFEFQDLLSENNEKLLEKTAEVNSQSNKENEMRQAELTSKMREMELSIKNEIYQTINQMALSGQFSSAGPVVNQAPASPEMAMPEMTMSDMAMPEMETFDADAQLAAMMAEETSQDLVSEDMSLDDLSEPTVDMEFLGEETLSEEISLEGLTTSVEEASSEEVVDELPAMEDLPSFDELPIDELSVPDDLGMDIPEAVIDEPVEEAPPMPDLSDPNKMMSPDDIAALLANMGGDSAPADEPEPEPVVEEVAEPETVAEAPVEEAPPMPDLSDPNKMMSPDDIAALLANMGGDSAPADEPVAEPEPESVVEEVVEPESVAEAPVEEAPPMPDLSDPNKMMSPDDIAALLANMGGDSAPAEEPAPEPEPVAEEKPPMPDLSDPNKTLSPDEIEALFANL